MERIVKEEGDLRVKIVLDEYPDQPHDDGGCPVLRIDWRFGDVEHTGYGDHYDPGFRPADALGYFISQFDVTQGIEVFERYVRVFHEGSVVEYGGGARGTTYVAFTTRTLARAWGVPDDQPVPDVEISEWEAYLEGDVWGYVVEKKVTWQRLDSNGEPVFSVSPCFIETWEELDSCWGFYGEEYAVQAAEEALEWHVEDGAA